MPLVRVKIRDEYGLGSAELYREASRQEDPKAVLDGVAVAGLVGLLRQLGDLAEFAAEVFHGLQDQIASTTSRSRRLLARVQKLEVALPTLEKAVFAQTSHVHFAYVAGCDWRPQFKKKRSSFAWDDLPRFILDAYEECRDPPRLHMLDKFDIGSSGSCLKRYSDPSFFRRASNNLKQSDAITFYQDKKYRKRKKKKSSVKNQDSWSASTSNLSGRVQRGTIFTEGKPLSSSNSSFDMPLKSHVQNQKDHVYEIIPQIGNQQSANKDYVFVRSNMDTHGESSSGKSEKVVDHGNGIVIPKNSSEHNGSSGVDKGENETVNADEQLDDGGSDSGRYLDALNVIDSESDNDLDHRISHNSLDKLDNQVRSNDSVSSKLDESNHISYAMDDSRDNMVQTSAAMNSEADFDGVCDDNLHSSVRNPQSTVNGVSDNSETGCSGSSWIKSSESESVLAETRPVNIWTNGGLLGLEPSKPSDSVSSENFDHGCNCNGQDKVLEITKEKPENREEIIVSSVETCQAKDQNVESGHGFPANGLISTVSKEQIIRTDKPVKPIKEEFRWNLDIYSPNSSPPLRHMNISFNPPGVFPMANFRLKYPDEQDDDATVSNFYPSFQLLPENIVSLDDLSASDDDTFCRSSLYGSHDCSDNFSDMDSELWEDEHPSSSSRNNATCFDIDMNPEEDKSLSSLGKMNGKEKINGDDTCQLDSLSHWQDLKTTLNEMEIQSPQSSNQENLDPFPPWKEPNILKKNELFLSTISPSSEVSINSTHQVQTKNLMVNLHDASIPVNNKVATILRKADAIRQAITNSGEQDDDSSWSDS